MHQDLERKRWTVLVERKIIDHHVHFYLLFLLLLEYKESVDAQQCQSKWTVNLEVIV